jgi:hypothetical protein
MSVAIRKGVIKTGQIKLVILSGKKAACMNIYGPLALQQKYANLTT